MLTIESKKTFCYDDMDELYCEYLIRDNRIPIIRGLDKITENKNEYLINGNIVDDVLLHIQLEKRKNKYLNLISCDILSDELRFVLTKIEQSEMFICPISRSEWDKKKYRNADLLNLFDEVKSLGIDDLIDINPIGINIIECSAKILTKFNLLYVDTPYTLYVKTVEINRDFKNVEKSNVREHTNEYHLESLEECKKQFDKLQERSRGRPYSRIYYEGGYVTKNGEMICNIMSDGTIFDDNGEIIEINTPTFTMDKFLDLASKIRNTPSEEEYNEYVLNCKSYGIENDNTGEISLIVYNLDDRSLIYYSNQYKKGEYDKLKADLDLVDQDAEVIKEFPNNQSEILSTTKLSTYNSYFQETLKELHMHIIDFDNILSEKNKTLENNKNTDEKKYVEEEKRSRKKLRGKRNKNFKKN